MRRSVTDEGKLANKRTVPAKGPLPEVVICLGPAVFVPGNKAFALATLRHEIEHAAHDEMAVEWVRKWRDAGWRASSRLARLELTCGPDNRASQGVAERCGFTREGVLRSHMPFKGTRRDTVVFSLLPGELRSLGASQ